MKDFFHQRGQILEEMYEWIKNMYRAENERPVIVIGNFTEKDYAFLKIVYHVFCLTKKPSADNPEMKDVYNYLKEIIYKWDRGRERDEKTDNYGGSS